MVGFCTRAGLRFGILVVAIFMLSMTVIAQGNSGNGGNECPSGYFGDKIEDVYAGASLTDAFGVTFTITSIDNTGLSWSSTEPLDYVYVKGGPGDAVEYSYDEASSGSGLFPPQNPNNGKYYGYSHVTFCYDLELTVSKTAFTEYTRELNYEVLKSVSPDFAHKFVGESFSPEWTVTVNQTGSSDYGHRVFGEITIFNDTFLDAEGINVIDLVEGNAASVYGCETQTLAAGATLVCSYEYFPGGVLNGTNVVTVETSGMVKGGSATAPVVFGDPTTVINANPYATDDNYGNIPFTLGVPFTYQTTYSCNSDEGQHYNLVELFGDNSVLLDSDDATFELICHEPDPSKSAVPVHTVTYDWDVDKNIDVPVHEMLMGQTANYNWTVGVTQYVTNDYSVTGQITVNNSNPVDVMNVTLTDVISGGIVPALDCGGALAVPAGGSASCGYATTLPDSTNRVNTVTVSLNGYDYVATRDITFGDPVVNGYPQVNVSDSNGMSWLFSGTDSKTYPGSYTCGSDYDYTNTATITETGESDDASVDVNCYGHSVSKSGSGTYNVDDNWGITKECGPNEYIVPYDSTQNWECVIGITHSQTSSGYSYSGDIVVTNNAPFEVTYDVYDELPGAVLDCGGTITVAANSSNSCGFSGTAATADDLFNEAEVVNQYGFSVSQSTNIGFTPVYNGPNPVSVYDNLANQTWSGITGATSFSYTMSHYCGESSTYVNTAVINETGQTANDTVAVTCEPPPVNEWCSPGAWKNSLADQWPDGTKTQFYNDVIPGEDLEGNPTLWEVLSDPSNPNWSGHNANLVADYLAGLLGWNYDPVNREPHDCPLLD